MTILSIETSCDETALSIIETSGDATVTTFRVLADNILSQIDIHKDYGGVFPMLAKREHARTLVPLLVKTLKDAGLYQKTSRHVIESPLRKEFQDILDHEPELYAQFITEIPHVDRPPFDAIAVTQGPGLEPALWVGINFAKALSMVWKIPVIAVNHMEGHLLAPLLKKTTDEKNFAFEKVEFPLLGLLVSGGHTELVLMRDWGSYEIIGETRDDAVGEAFDKVARMLGLPYPGGPEIARIGENGKSGVYPLPRPMLQSNDYAFSFAGLKTAVLYLVKKLGVLNEKQKADIAREFEDACIEVLVAKTLRAAEEYGARTIVMGGGVSANTCLRETLTARVAAKLSGVHVYIPGNALSTDNALMIAVAGALKKEQATMDTSGLRALGHWRLNSEG